MKKTFGLIDPVYNFKLISRYFNYTYSPHWFYENRKLSYNFDIGFIDDGNESSDFISFLINFKIPYIGIPRYYKNKQHKLLKDFNIKTPDTYYYSGEANYNTLMSVLCDFEGNENIVVKLNMGARGLGTTIIRKKDIQKYVHEFDEGVCNSKSEIAVEANPENKTDRHTLNGITSNQVIYQKKIEVIEEFRCIYTFGNSPLIYSRGYNSEKSFGNASVAKKETPLLKTLDIKEFEFVTPFFESLNSPYIAFDLYRDKNGDLGVFEFQQEFGHMWIDEHSILIDNMKSGVLNLIEKKGLNKK